LFGGTEIRSTDPPHDVETGKETYESTLKYNIGKDRDRNNTREGREPQEARDMKSKREKGRETQKGKDSALAERPKWCTDRTNAMIWGLWPECSGRWPVDL
jgi:hypothetical protein